MSNKNVDFSGIQEAISNVDKQQEPICEVPASSAPDWRKSLQQKLAPLASFNINLLANNTEISYRPMNTKDMKQLLMFGQTSDPRVIEDALDRLICSVIETPGFQIDNLITFDRIYLLVMIRINSKGGSLESSYTCSKCENQVAFTQNLTSFEITPMPKNPNKEIVVSDDFSLLIDYNTRRDQKEIFKYTKAKTEDALKTDLAMLNYAALIKGVKVDGAVHTFPEFTYQDRVNTFMDLPESVFDKIIDWDKKNAFGVQLSYDRVCPHCGNVDNVDIPVSNLF